MPEKFDQLKYQEEWKKRNMLKVTASYKKDFVEEFRAACETLGIKQSEVFRAAMIETINKAKNQ